MQENFNTKPNRTRRIVLTLALAAAALARGPSLGAQAAPLRVLTDDSYPPYSFRGADGALQGILVDQWLAWQAATGRKVELVGLPWAEAQKRILSGEVAVIDTMFDTPQRRLAYSLGRPYASIESSVFFQRDINGIAGLSDLKGSRVAVKAGDACIEDLRAAGVEDLSEYKDYEAIIRAASKGEERIFCVDRPPALHFMAKYGIAGQFRSSRTLQVGNFHRAVLKGREALLKEAEDGFSKLSAATLSRIDEKWMGNALPPGIDPSLLLLSASGIAGIIVLLLFFN